MSTNIQLPAFVLPQSHLVRTSSLLLNELIIAGRDASDEKELVLLSPNRTCA